MELSYKVFKKISKESEVFGIPIFSFCLIISVSMIPSALLSYLNLYLFGMKIDLLFFIITFLTLLLITKIMDIRGFPPNFITDLINYHKRNENFTFDEIYKNELKILDSHENMYFTKEGVSFLYNLKIDDLRSYEDEEIKSFYLKLKTEIKERINSNLEIQFLYSKRNEKVNNLKEQTDDLSKILTYSENGLKNRSATIFNYISFNYYKENISRDEGIQKRNEIEKHKFLGLSLKRAEDVLSQIFKVDAISEKNFVKSKYSYHGILSLTDVPEISFYGFLDEIKEDYPDILISLRIKYLDNVKFKKNLERKRDFASKLSSKKGLSNIEEESKINELNDVFSIISEGEIFLKGSFSIIVSEKNIDSLNKSIKNIQSLFSQYGGKICYEKYGFLSRLKSTLPFPTYKDDRNFIAFLNNLLFFLPLHSKNQLEREFLPLINPENEIFYVDPFHKEMPNKNMLIVASSGSGKSFLASSLVLKTLKVEKNAKFIIIDIGGSYKKLTKILGGSYIDINEDSSFQIVPEVITGKNKNSFLTMLCAFSGALNKNDKADIYSALESFLLGSSKNSLEAFYKYLKVENEVLAKNLSLYIKSGPFGKIFDNKNSLNFTNKLTALDLKNINEFLSSPEEKNLFLLALLSSIWTHFSKPNDLDTPKYLIIDECWNLINTKEGSQFLESAARTFRKHNASLITITQSIDDFSKNLSSKSVLTNSSSKVILKQNTKNQIENISKVLGLNENEINLVKSLQVEKGEFSELLLMRSGKRSIKGAYFPDKASYFISTSDPSDNIMIEEKKKETGSYLNAIKALAFSFIILLGIPAYPDFWGGDIPFLMQISANTMSTLNHTREVLSSTKKHLENAIKTYDEIKRSNDLITSYYNAGKDGLQLKDIDLLLGRGTSSALKGIYENAKDVKGIERKNLVSLKDSIEDAQFVNGKLFGATKKFNDNLIKAEAINKLYGDRSAKGAFEIGNLYTKNLLDLNLVEIMQRHTQMKFKSKKEKMEIEARIEDELKLASLDSELNKTIKTPNVSYKDPMRR